MTSAQPGALDHVVDTRLAWQVVVKELHSKVAQLERKNKELAVALEREKKELKAVVGRGDEEREKRRGVEQTRERPLHHM